MVFTNVSFLKESYIQDFKSQSKVVLEDISNSIVTLMDLDVENVPINEETQKEQHTPREPRRSGRIVRQLDRFMSIGEALEAKTIGHENDLSNYIEAI